MFIKKILLCFLGLLIGNGLGITIFVIWKGKYFAEFWSPFELFIIESLITSVQMLIFCFIFLSVGKYINSQLLKSNINFLVLGVLYAFFYLLAEHFIFIPLNLPLTKIVAKVITNSYVLYYIIKFFSLFLFPFIIFSIIVTVYSEILKILTR